MQQDADNRMKTAQRRCKDDHNRQIRKAPKKIEIEQSIYLDRPPMIKSAAERLAAEAYSKLLSTKSGPFRLIKVKPKTLTIDEDGIRNAAPVDQDTVASTAKKTPTVDDRTKTDDKDAE